MLAKPITDAYARLREMDERGLIKEHGAAALRNVIVAGGVEAIG